MRFLIADIYICRFLCSKKRLEGSKQPTVLKDPDPRERVTWLIFCTIATAALFGTVEHGAEYGTGGMGNVVVGKAPTKEANILGIPEPVELPAPPNSMPDIAETG